MAGEEGRSGVVQLAERVSAGEDGGNSGSIHMAATVPEEAYGVTNSERDAATNGQGMVDMSVNFSPVERPQNDSCVSMQDQQAGRDLTFDNDQNTDRLGRMDGSTRAILAEEYNDGLKELGYIDENASEADDEGPRGNGCSRCCRKTCSSISKHKWSLFCFLVGVVLVTAGLCLYFIVIDDVSGGGLFDEYQLIFGLIISGSILMSHFFGVYLSVLSWFVLEKLPNFLLGEHKTAEEARYLVALTQHYVSGVYKYFPWMLMFPITILLWYIFLTPTMRQVQAESFQNLVRIAGVCCLFIIALAAAKLTRMYYLQDFGTKNYKTRMLSTIRYQYILQVVTGKPLHKGFSFLYHSLEESASDQISPTMWSTVKSYIHTHQIDGEPVDATAAPGEIEKLYPASEQFSKLIRSKIKRRMAIFQGGGASGELMQSTSRSGTPDPTDPDRDLLEDDEVLTKDEFLKILANYFPSIESHGEAWWTQSIDVDGINEVRLGSFYRSVLQLFQDRANISLTLLDADEVLKSMDSAFFGGYIFIWILLTLSIFNITLGASLAAIISAILAWSFVFGNTIREGFEGLVFLFGTHLYDTGDKVEFDGMLCEVVRIRTMTTDFLIDSGKFIRLENAKMRAKAVVNLSTSKSFSQGIAFYVHAHEFSSVLIKELQESADAFIKEHPNDFLGTTITARQFNHAAADSGGIAESGNFVKIVAFTRFTRTCFNTGANHIARTVLFDHVCKEFVRLGIGKPVLREGFGKLKSA